MSDKLSFNGCLIGFKGIIGRWDFCLNLIYLCMINLLFSGAASAYIMAHAESLTDFFNVNTIFLQAPLLLKLWVLGGNIFIVCVGISLIIRRLNDINAKVNTTANIIVSVFYAVVSFRILFPFLISSVMFLINAVIFLFLIVKKGKITGEYPYDYRKEFNWGAFFGTWLWGLFNKAYKTLWMLILGLTPWGFLYSLVCGFKGNKWASENGKLKTVEEFKQSQENQAVVFTVLALFVLPFVYFLIVTVFVLTFTFSAINETKTSPDGKSNTMQKLESALNSFGSLYFESYNITPDENKFYILPEDWKSYSFSDKKDILDMAATMAATARNKKSSGHYSTKAKELPRTKIYNSKNGELLGEFYMPENFPAKAGIKDVIKASMNAYKFYNPTVE